MNNWKKGKNSPRFVDYSLLTQPKRRAMIPVSSDPPHPAPTQEKRTII